MKYVWLLLLLAGCAGARQEPISDWERKNQERLGLALPEDRPATPPYPKKEDLVEIYVSATTDFKYFVDASTLSVAPKGRTVRYVLVARSPSGVENVTYESIRCPDQYRVLAVGQGDGKWSGRQSDWRDIQRGSGLSWQYALARNYFCPHRDPIRTVDEGVDALRRGSHPAVYVDPKNMGGGSN
jgi:hypothetical protein